MVQSSVIVFTPDGVIAGVVVVFAVGFACGLLIGWWYRNERL